ncbi:substrate-binding periplasmic protein [Thalassomonas actiniarum]|uniref:Transporter substrate-binding domain-containing protein n=1 Tax=Thalassomonas actiniarum TaxID=485447 RepID=A0AAE9YW87_9GAMM|nr:transporter substrate-binding domain-containing protein [Thalassomonas actiniarum]WDE01519.1 transporter substrate-binding domain-containing protein [Thalassomonas actiniarum]
MKKGYLLVVCLLVSLTVYGQSPLQIKLVSGDYPPFTGEFLPDGGLVTRLVQVTFAQAFDGAQIKVSFEPWARGLANTENQKYQATFPYFRNEQRAAAFYFSDPVIFIENVFYHNQAAEAKSYDKKTICLPLGYAKGSLDKLIQTHDMTLIRPASMLQCFKMLAKARVDFLACSKRVGQFFTGHYPQFQGLKFSPSGSAMALVPLYAIFPKKSGLAIVTRFNLALQQLKRSGSYQEILDSYRVVLK